jgi:hypothetical protein
MAGEVMMSDLDRRGDEPEQGLWWPLPCGSIWRMDTQHERCRLPLGHEARWCENASGTIRWMPALDMRQGQLFGDV